MVYICKDCSRVIPMRKELLKELHKTCSLCGKVYPISYFLNQEESKMESKKQFTVSVRVTKSYELGLGEMANTYEEARAMVVDLMQSTAQKDLEKFDKIIIEALDPETYEPDGYKIALDSGRSFAFNLKNEIARCKLMQKQLTISEALALAQPSKGLT